MPDLEVDNFDIKFDKVDFGYGEKNLFDSFSLTIDQGSKIGVIGISGGGKTTFVSLLLKLYRPDTGSITIGGQNINQFNNQSLYQSISYVPQQIVLLHSSIYENIIIAKPDASKSEVDKAVRLACLEDFIDKTDNGYNTIIGDRGIKLSGGQRQRVSLARVFLRNPEIVILDEATSNLDPKLEQTIHSNIKKYFKTRQSSI